MSTRALLDGLAGAAPAEKAAQIQALYEKAAFSPVTDLLALSEFAGQEDNPLVQSLALASTAEALADRDAWITIGNADARVSTDKAVAFANTLPRVTMRVLPTPGHHSPPEWHDDAAHWMAAVCGNKQIGETSRNLSSPVETFREVSTGIERSRKISTTTRGTNHAPDITRH